jgi:isoleucyl-tRNA synthetase
MIKRKAKLNFKVAGPKFGKEVKNVQKLVEDLHADNINQLMNEGRTSFVGYELTSEDVQIYTENIEGWLIESQDNITVALDTTLDDDLVNEGIAREFVSKVQNIRKERDMDVNDKIRIIYDAEGGLDSILTGQKKYISEHTMAMELSPLNGAVAGSFDEININGRVCKVYIEKIG